MSDLNENRIFVGIWEGVHNEYELVLSFFLLCCREEGDRALGWSRRMHQVGPECVLRKRKIVQVSHGRNGENGPG
jgi:hypothetical protein